MFRIKKGKNFIYVDKNKKPIKDKKQLERIKGLRIPPAWPQVIVNQNPEAFIQAIGKDEKDRAQYIYSSEHKKLASMQKFKRMIYLAEKHQFILDKLKDILKSPGYTKLKAIVLVLFLIHLTSLRVGNEKNQKLYNSHGLTTLLGKHIKFKNNQAELKFIGKKGVENVSYVRDKLILKHLKDWKNKFKIKTNDPFFQYIGINGKLYTVTANDINKFLKSIGPFTAKDIRTYNANMHLIKNLEDQPLEETKTKIKKSLLNALKLVAQHLNNTPTVARKEYCSSNIVNHYLEHPKQFLTTLKRFKKRYPCDCYKKMLIYTLKG